PNWDRTRSWWSTCPAAATRTSRPLRNGSTCSTPGAPDEGHRMSRLAPLFESCRGEQRAALIGYLPTGFPDVATSISAMTALVESGCDLVEVGVPYSDPGMDGPTVAAATDVALRGGVRVRDSLAAVEAISNAGGKAV